MNEDVLTDAIGDLRSLIEGNREAEGCLRTITDALARVRGIVDRVAADPATVTDELWVYSIRKALAGGE